MAFVFNPFTGTLDQKLVVEGTSSEISGNIALNDNYISNDGGDEGISITDAGAVAISGTIELGHATDTTLARASSGDINIDGNAIYRAGGTDVPVLDGGTGASNSNAWLNSRITTSADGSLNYDATGAVAVNHDQLDGIVANEHLDWTASVGTIDAGNYTNTTYTKASFDLDHLFTLVDAAADTSENLGTFTGSTISDSVTIKAALQALETTVETKAPIAGPTFTGTIAIPNISNLETAVAANTAKATNVTTDLSVSRDGTKLDVVSSDGTNAVLPLADTNNWGVMSDEMFDEHTANNAKVTDANHNVSTALSTGTVNTTSYGITSDGGADDVVIAQASTSAAGVLSAAKWDEIVANTAKVTDANHNVTTNLSISRDGTKLDVVSSDGTNAVLPLADTDNWGVMSDEMFDEHTANNAKTGITSGQASAITANTAKVTNATHTGDVTGGTALTIGASKVITSMILDDNVTADKLANSINTDIATGVSAVPYTGASSDLDLGSQKLQIDSNTLIELGNSAEATLQYKTGVGFNCLYVTGTAQFTNAVALGSPITWTLEDTLPSVQDGNYFIAGISRNGFIITNFALGIVGQQITIYVNTGTVLESVEIADNSTINLAGGTNFSMKAGDNITLVLGLQNSGEWYEIARTKS